MGVVLIVALLGWTVSVTQPLLARTGMCSRAAVGVPAGASPAYKPEPSPSRRSCCPPEGTHSSVAQPPSSHSRPSACSINPRSASEHNLNTPSPENKNGPVPRQGLLRLSTQFLRAQRLLQFQSQHAHEFFFQPLQFHFPRVFFPGPVVQRLLQQLQILPQLHLGKR